MTEISYEITINAALATVYAHFTERDGLLRWMGVEASADPVPGGELTWTHENGATMIGRFIELDPPHRLLFSYGWKDALMGTPPESTIVQVLLTATDEGTWVQLTHRDLRCDSAEQHEQGWHHFLTRLNELASRQ